MNILIIFCHPSKASYTYQVLQRLREECLQKSWPVEVSDLYATNFQSDMTEEEYQREGFSLIDLPIPDDILQEHRKIDKADCIIFLYPVWWGDCPAKLKGWFDRVYTVGYAYKQKEGFPSMKKVPLGLAVCTAGYTNEYLEETGMAQSIQTVMLNDRLGQRFAQKELFILGGTIDKGSATLQHATQIKKIMNKLEAL